MSACSHGILAIAIQLYKKGASPAAVVAFLLAAPWANLTMTLILISFFVWIMVSLELGFDFILLLLYILSFFWVYGILYVLAGIIIGYLFGNYYKKRENVGKESPLF